VLGENKIFLQIWYMSNICCESSSEKVGILSLALLALLWGMAPGSTFGMICGVETRPQGSFPNPFWYCSSAKCLCCGHLRVFGLAMEHEFF